MSVATRLKWFSGFLGVRRFPKVHSAEIAECGLACLAMIARFHGHNTSLAAIRSRFPLSINGTNLPTLAKIARELHLEPHAKRLEMEGLRVLRTPCILHWNMNHFVVLTKISRQHASIVDPVGGARRLSMNAVDKSFTGIALELQPASTFAPINDKEQPLRLRDFWRQIADLKKYLLQLLLLMGVVQAFALLSPLYIQTVVDKAIPGFDREFLFALGIGFGLLTIFGAILGVLRGLVSMHMGISFSFRLNDNLLSHILKLPLTFFESRHIGDINSRFGSLQSVRSFVGGNLISLILDAVAVFASLSLMLTYSTALTLLVVGVAAGDFCLRMIFFLRVRELTEDRINAAARTNSNFMETIRAIAGIKIFGRESHRQKLWRALTTEQHNLDIRLGRWNLSLGALRQMMSGLENTLVIALAGLMIIEAKFSVGMLFAFIAYKGQFLGGVHGLFDKINEFRMLRLHLERLSEIALAKPEEEHGEDHLILNAQDVKGSLELRNICFRYGTGEPYVLKDCCLKLRAGESVALTGPSGCGKTTLMKVAIGLLAHQSGRILLDGIDISKIGVKQYRRFIGAVMQDDTLMSGTLAENICLFDPEVDMERIVECARLASIHDDIESMPMRYNSLVGDMGSSLSGGQKQRILLARALYPNPRILFLDEATSHLDASNEKLASEAIRQLSTTRLIIAHRKETVETADRAFTFVRTNEGRWEVSEQLPD